MDKKLIFFTAKMFPTKAEEKAIQKAKATPGVTVEVWNGSAYAPNGAPVLCDDVTGAVPKGFRKADAPAVSTINPSDDPADGDYKKMGVKDLRALVAEREIDTDATSKKDLIAALELADTDGGGGGEDDEDEI